MFLISHARQRQLIKLRMSCRAGAALGRQTRKTWTPGIAELLTIFLFMSTLLQRLRPNFSNLTRTSQVLDGPMAGDPDLPFASVAGCFVGGLGPQKLGVPE